MMTPKLSRNQQIEEFVRIGARRCDAVAVMDADELVERGMQAETFAFSLQMRRLDRLENALKILKGNLIKKGNS
jgi:regulator of extracellular matrix RemA (YlzA/DUF370 family)